ncbi:hypothetical protein ACWGNF_09040 [Streptomyces sp. NPDC055808]
MSWNRAVAVEHGGRIGAGCVVAPGVILTAYHLIASAAESGSRPVVRVLNEGADAAGARAEVAWRRDDAVLLRCRPRSLGDTFSPVRWGELICTKPGFVPRCSAVGLPRAAVRRDPGGAGGGDRSYRAPAQLTGRINVVDNASHTYSFQLDGALPEHHSGQGSSPWQGMSGAGIFCEDLLLALITAAPAGWNHGRLNAIPVRQLLDDLGFCDIIEQAAGTRPRLEPADLDGLFDSPPRPVVAPSYLLSPRAETVRFTGLDTEMSRLAEWCGTSRTVDVAVVHGPGGIGKTRIATELARRLSERRLETDRSPARQDIPWAAGFLSEKPVSQPPPYADLRHLVRPVLVIVDYAESRQKQVERLLTVLAAHQAPGRRIRVLLLARSTRDWWDRLSIRHPALTSGLALALSPDALYRHLNPAQLRHDAALAFSRRIALIHRADRDGADFDEYDGDDGDFGVDGCRDDDSDRDAATDRAGPGSRDAGDVDPGAGADPVPVDAPALAPVPVPALVPVPVPVTEDGGNILGVHMDALADVLLHSPHEFPDGLPPVWMVLVDHEMKYVQRGARRERLDLGRDYLDTLLTVQGMARAADKEEATAVFQVAWDVHYHGLAVPPPLGADIILKLRRMMRALYPAPDGAYLGGTGPDMLVGALIDQHQEEDAGFLEQVLASPVLSSGQRRRSLTAVSRAFPTQPALRAGTARLVATHAALSDLAKDLVHQMTESERTRWLAAVRAARSSPHGHVPPPTDRQPRPRPSRIAPAPSEPVGWWDSVNEASGLRLFLMVAVPVLLVTVFVVWKLLGA